MKQNKNAKNKLDEIKRIIVLDILDQFHNNDWREAPEQDRNWEVQKNEE